MKYIDLTFPAPEENLACDEALLDFCEEGQEDEILRFWEPDGRFIVLGYANQAAAETDLDACRTHNVPIFRRCSGGGTVMQGPGCLNYSLILRISNSSPLESITGANRFILERHRAALEPLLPAQIEIQGHTDLAVNNLKFSGNAQRRRKKCLIFHGTFLLNFDFSLMGKVLRMPSRQPDYRKNRPHGEFITNLNLPAEAVKSALREIWNASKPLLTVPQKQMRELVVQKYSTDEWNLKC